MAETTVLVLLLVVGILTHYVKKVGEEWKQGNKVKLLTYWTNNPYHALFSILGASGGFLLLYGTPELTKLTAWGLGYMCNSVADIMGSRTMRKLDK